MMRSGLVAGVLLVSACHALPSAVPLADSAPPDADDWVPSRRALALTEGGHGDDGDESDAVADADEFAVTASRADDGAASAEKSGDSPAAEGADAGVAGAVWPGEYYGSDRFVWRDSEGREVVEVDDKAHTRVERGGPNAVVITIVNSLTGEVICALDAAVNGKEARVREGETCFGGPDREAAVTDGLATLEGDRLVLDFKGRIEDEPDDGDDDDEDDEGGGEEGTYHFDGRRR